jgi:hypothetical protein
MKDIDHLLDPLGFAQPSSSSHPKQELDGFPRKFPQSKKKKKNTATLYESYANDEPLKMHKNDAPKF